ncbi:ABC transporter permease [Bacillus alkalicellulosilyticus]|uniref:ABC transporter permease n=1 Tax=Alkalihalobacterium alkalicellulosilyticum TaxID=1912214 RepID=UPI000996ECA3|nr:ABC transporter permease [Bacillus alkalicellulosilyticus]
MMRHLKNYLGSFILIAGLLVIWEIGAGQYDKKYILPTPSDIFLRMIDLHDLLFFVHLPATLKIILLGLSLSILFGVGLAVWMNMNTMAERTFFPIVIASQTIPIIALAPIFVLWFGYDIWSKVVVTILITFFPITVGTFDGLRSTKKEYIDLVRTMGATKRHIFFKIQVPTALPYFFSSLKVAVTLSVIGAAIGEWLGADAGLGYFSRRMMTQFDGAGVFAPIVWLSFLGIVLFLLVKAIESYLLKWRKTQ